jgi:putative addiction module component (TIGR02574 family)
MMGNLAAMLSAATPPSRNQDRSLRYGASAVALAETENETRGRRKPTTSWTKCSRLREPATGGTCSCGAGRRELLPPPGFDDLSVDEKIDYLQSLWDRIAGNAETIPVPDWHHQIIDDGLKDREADPDAGDSLDAVQKRLRKKFDSHDVSPTRHSARQFRKPCADLAPPQWQPPPIF